MSKVFHCLYSAWLKVKIDCYGKEKFFSQCSQSQPSIPIILNLPHLKQSSSKLVIVLISNMPPFLFQNNVLVFLFILQMAPDFLKNLSNHIISDLYHYFFCYLMYTGKDETNFQQFSTIQAFLSATVEPTKSGLINALQSFCFVFFCSSYLKQICHIQLKNLT